MLDVEYLDPDEYDLSTDVFPEVAMDDGDDDEYGRMTLAVANASADVSNICYVTVYDATLLDGNGVPDRHAVVFSRERYSRRRSRYVRIE